MHGETSGGGLRACGGVALVALLLGTSGLSRAADAIPPSPANEEARCDGYPAAGSAANPGRDPRGGGFVDYLDLFYCVLGGSRRPALGYAAMAAWLAVLFYLLADTAAVYFCSSLEGLARLLGLPPAIAGATLLSLGNGAPDALSALASFAAGAGGGAAAAVGLSSVLGGAMFVSTAVLGVVALRVGAQGVRGRRRPRQLLPGRGLPPPGPRRGRSHHLGRRGVRLALPRLRPRRRLHPRPLDETPG